VTQGDECVLQSGRTPRPEGRSVTGTLPAQNTNTDKTATITTRYGVDGRGIESRLGRDFPHLYRPALRSTQPPIQWVPGLISFGYDYFIWVFDYFIRVYDYFIWVLIISFGYILYCVCFNLYCGGFKLFCNVWLCVCVCIGGFCNVWVSFVCIL
jgi:hypothetical protein